METGLLVCERAILECFDGCRGLYLQDINKKLNLGENVISKILEIMIKRKILTKIGSEYHKNKISLSCDAIREEVEDVIKSFLRSKVQQGKHFHIGAYYLSPFEEKVFKFHQDNLNQFIQSLKKNEHRENLAKRKVIFYGIGDFQEILQESLSLVD